MFKILVADDDALSSIIQRFLVGKGFQVLLAEDGEQTLKIISTEKPQLLILDLSMPKKNGYEVCAAVRADSDSEISGIKIVVTSAKQYKVDIRAAQEAGADDYLTKPYHIADLMAAIERLLYKHSAARSLSSTKKKTSY